MADYTANSQQRVLVLIPLLAGHEFTGLSIIELMDKTSTNRSTMIRDLHNLQTAGLAQELPTAKGKWRLSPQMVHIASAYSLARKRALEEFNKTTDGFDHLG